MSKSIKVPKGEPIPGNAKGCFDTKPKINMKLNRKLPTSSRPPFTNNFVPNPQY